MSDVKHMKWWGWGVEGVGFHWQDKPAFAPFVLDAVGLDLHTAVPVQPPAFEDLSIAGPVLARGILETLQGIVGDDDATIDPMERVVHTYGKSLRDLVRIRANTVERYVDIVVYPDDEQQVQAV
ncbi:hypothetical protein, partial [Mesorhizobium japonicum]|uniref:hypothetical protein n=1 Tax=Mesorhizobium japonicum TaxID=2066070 RepID=UPI003B59BFBA